MVAHNLTDTLPLLAVMVRRRPFFQEDPLIMFLTLGLYVMPPDKVEVEPCFVVAALIGGAQAQNFTRNRRRHHEAVLSSADRIQAVSTHKRQPNCPESIQVPTMVWGREASAERSQQRPPQ